jgi:hypothetical protein
LVGVKLLIILRSRANPSQPLFAKAMSALVVEMNFCSTFAWKSSPEGEDLDGGAFDFKVNSTPIPTFPQRGRRQALSFFNFNY